MLDKISKQRLLSKAKEQDTITYNLLGSLVRQNKDWRESRLANVYIGKCFALYEVMHIYKFEKEELEEFEWVYKYGI